MDEDGRVNWVPQDLHLGEEHWFVLTATDDSGATDSVTWPVRVEPRQPSAHAAWRQVGCQHPPGSPMALWVGLIAALGLRRRHPRINRP